MGYFKGKRSQKDSVRIEYENIEQQVMKGKYCSDLLLLSLSIVFSERQPCIVSLLALLFDYIIIYHLYPRTFEQYREHWRHSSSRDISSVFFFFFCFMKKKKNTQALPAVPQIRMKLRKYLYCPLTSQRHQNCICYFPDLNKIQSFLPDSEELPCKN